MEAYILVHKAGFTYGDVKQMLKSERTAFIKFLTDEIKAENDAIKSARNHR
jgi:hypothetical protein